MIFGPVIALIFVIILGYLLLKDYNPHALLLIAGLLMLGIAMLMKMPMPQLLDPSGLKGFDLFVLIRESFSGTNANVGLMIMVIGGFVSYIDKIGASKALVDLALKPLSVLKKHPHIAAVAVIPIGQVLFICIPSAAGMGLLLMASVFPILTGLGVSRITAVSVITACTAFGLGPASAMTAAATHLAGLDAVVYFLNFQIPIAWPLSIVLIVSYYFVNRYFDRRTETGTVLKSERAKERESGDTILSETKNPLSPQKETRHAERSEATQLETGTETVTVTGTETESETGTGSKSEREKERKSGDTILSETKNPILPTKETRHAERSEATELGTETVTVTGTESETVTGSKNERAKERKSGDTILSETKNPLSPQKETRHAERSEATQLETETVTVTETVTETVTGEDEQNGINPPKLYAIIPVLPLILLVVFSEIFDFLPFRVKLDTTTAMFISLFFGIGFELIRTRNVKKVLSTLTSFWNGMGNIFKSVVTLIIAADIFAKGLIALGFIDGLVNLSQSLGLGAMGIAIVMTCIIFFASMLMGSGNAAFFAFGPLVPKIAKAFGVDAVKFILPMNMAASMGRTVSPVAGVLISVAEIAGVSSLQIVKRNVIPLGIALIFMLLIHFIQW
ncbi:MAG: TRAP transporter large permease subunit [Bacteroidetes bacterium]|nr:TRAP transporter large permease subunit [Bacteroidota bacterium]